MPQTLKKKEDVRIAGFLSFSVPSPQYPKHLGLNPWVGGGNSNLNNKERKNSSYTNSLWNFGSTKQRCFDSPATESQWRRGMCTWAPSAECLSYPELWPLGSSCTSVLPLVLGVGGGEGGRLTPSSADSYTAAVGNRGGEGLARAKRGIRSFAGKGKWCPYP